MRRQINNEKTAEKLIYGAKKRESVAKTKTAVAEPTGCSQAAKRAAAAKDEATPSTR